MTFASSSPLSPARESALKASIVALREIAYLVNPSNPSAEIYAKEAATAASALGIEVPVLNAGTAEVVCNLISRLEAVAQHEDEQKTNCNHSAIML